MTIDELYEQGWRLVRMPEWGPMMAVELFSKRDRQIRTQGVLHYTVHKNTRRFRVVYIKDLSMSNQWLPYFSPEEGEGVMSLGGWGITPEGV